MSQDALAKGDGAILSCISAKYFDCNAAFEGLLLDKVGMADKAQLSAMLLKAHVDLIPRKGRATVPVHVLATGKVGLLDDGLDRLQPVACRRALRHHLSGACLDLDGRRRSERGCNVSEYDDASAQHPRAFRSGRSAQGGALARGWRKQLR